MTATAAAPLVLDTSVTATWLLPDEHDDAAARAYARLRGQALVLLVPDLWLWECSNIIANAVRRARVQPADAMRLWDLLDAVHDCVEPIVLGPSDVRECLRLAIEHGLSSYDAAYLWLARTSRCGLLTHDQRLAGAAQACGLPAVRVEDVA